MGRNIDSIDIVASEFSGSLQYNVLKFKFNAFDVLLTVHLSIFISVINQINVQIFVLQ